MEKFTFSGLSVRFLLALALVLTTFNPSGFSFLHWFFRDFPAITAPKVVAGLALAIAWVVFIRATLLSIGVIGVVLMGVFFGALIWLFVSWGWIDLTNGRAVAWITLLVVSLVLTAGLSWAHIRRRLSGQATVDEVDEH